MIFLRYNSGKFMIYRNNYAKPYKASHFFQNFYKIRIFRKRISYINLDYKEFKWKHSKKLIKKYKTI